MVGDIPAKGGVGTASAVTVPLASPADASSTAIVADGRGSPAEPC
jgi:hypothetical protein